MLCLVIQCIIMIHHVQCVLRSLSPSRFLSLSMFVFLEGLAHMMMAEQGTLTFPFLKRLYCVMHSLRVFFFLNANFFFSSLSSSCKRRPFNGSSRSPLSPLPLTPFQEPRAKVLRSLSLFSPPSSFAVWFEK